ncbi:hypothetical protein Tco_1240034, partial [Tanacetum coccineum]
MSIHNYENIDDDVADSVTLISKLDISDPLHLHPNDTTALTIVSIKLKGTENYQVWAKHVLEELKETYDKVDGSIMFGLHNKINTLKQNGSSIADYYHKLNALWKQYDAMIELPKCVCNASEETLPDVRSAYATISSEDSHRVAIGSIASSSQRN